MTTSSAVRRSIAIIIESHCEGGLSTRFCVSMVGVVKACPSLLGDTEAAAKDFIAWGEPGHGPPHMRCAIMVAASLEVEKRSVGTRVKGPRASVARNKEPPSSAGQTEEGGLTTGPPSLKGSTGHIPALSN